MIGLYFSGTGNSKYAVHSFLQSHVPNAPTIAIEDNGAALALKLHSKIVLAYPVQYSNIPKILRDFILSNKGLWQGKKIFLIATMGLFSGDGTGVTARLLKKCGAHITGGLHLKMPDSICDEKVLKHTRAQNQALVAAAGKQAQSAAMALKDGHPPQVGLGFISHLVGLFGQRLYFSGKTRHYSDKLKINAGKCIGCCRCITLCPMHNLVLQGGCATAKHNCTMCYRCIAHCPAQAITLLGKNITQQNNIEKYL